MPKIDDKFFSKIAKSISEFMILAILKEKGEAHTYEIQQTLLSKFSSHKAHSKEIISILNLLDESAVLKTKNGNLEDNSLGSSDFSEDDNLIMIFSQIIHTSKDDKQLKSLLHNLQLELEIIKDHIFFPVKIWETLGAIYQVMKELEDQGFIQVSRSEIVNGRTRKIYNITEKGELEAIRMIFIFNGINSSIYPQFMVFRKVMRDFYLKHVNNVNNLSKRLFSNESINLHDLGSLKREFDQNDRFNLNPFSESAFRIIIQVLGMNDISEDDIIEMFSLENKNFNSQVIGSLKEYQEKLEGLIKSISRYSE